VWSFRNGTVAVYDNGIFARYIVPPKSYFVSVTIKQNDDGSYFRYFSNGTQQWFAAPLTGDETAEIKAFRINSINSEPNGIQTFFYANGTVAVFNGSKFVKYLVKPTSFFVTRQVTIFPDGGFEERYSNGTTIRYSETLDERADELVRAYYITKQEFNADGTGKNFYFNGTIAATKDGNFIKYIVPPKSLYMGCIK
jgi:antitoxin component YwqK of YwqJK toxin-antitoxin module